MKKWGEGASMVRGEWKKRDEPHQEDGSSEDEAEDNEQKSEQGEHAVEEQGSDDRDLDALANSMTSLSLVPKTVRFGRGGKGGFVTNETTIRGGGRGRGGPGGGSQSKSKTQNGGKPDDSVMDVDVTPARGRGRGSFFPRGRVLRGGMRGAPKGILRGQGQ